MLHSINSQMPGKWSENVWYLGYTSARHMMPSLWHCQVNSLASLTQLPSLCSKSMSGSPHPIAAEIFLVLVVFSASLSLAPCRHPNISWVPPLGGALCRQMLLSTHLPCSPTSAANRSSEPSSVWAAGILGYWPEKLPTSIPFHSLKFSDFSLKSHKSYILLRKVSKSDYKIIVVVKIIIIPPNLWVNLRAKKMYHHLTHWCLLFPRNPTITCRPLYKHGLPQAF